MRNVIACVAVLAAATAGSPQELAKKERVRTDEFYRLAGEIQDRVWAGWSKTEAPLLLVTAEHEFLLHSESAPPGFTAGGEGILVRPRQFPLNFQATFPAFGPPSVIVAGTPENTASGNSTVWLFMLMHEHFHQLQDGQPGIHAKTEKLGLSHGDTSGMWMLNFPFPYERPEVSENFGELRDALAEALEEKDAEQFTKLAKKYAEKRKAFLAGISEEDRRYLEFQLWKEGIARYAEVKCAEAAAGYRPTAEFAALADFKPFAAQAAEARKATLAELRQIKLAEWKRGSVYAFGAAEGFLLDRWQPNWKSEYFEHPLTMSRYFEK